MTGRITLEALNKLPQDAFVGLLAGIFEHSPWVAESVAGQRPFRNLDALHQAMVARIESAGTEVQLRLIRAHPELAGKAAIRGELTAASTTEQAGAGLDQCTPEEYATLTALNQAYLEKFGFPFILAVRGYDRAGIIQAFQGRLANTYDQEFQACLAQIYKIGQFRLHELIRDPRGAHP